MVSCFGLCCCCIPSKAAAAAFPLQLLCKAQLTLPDLGLILLISLLHPLQRRCKCVHVKYLPDDSHIFCTCTHTHFGIRSVSCISRRSGIPHMLQEGNDPWQTLHSGTAPQLTEWMGATEGNRRRDVFVHRQKPNYFLDFPSHGNL